jgi:hypothetical protein
MTSGSDWRIADLLGADRPVSLYLVVPPSDISRTRPLVRLILSRGAAQVAQAGNELTALSVKQSLALQGLLAAQHRADTIAKARELAAEEEGKQRFKTFLGSGQAYTASK